MSTIQNIEDWHRAARPKPTQKDFDVQLACHFEEVAELVEGLTFHHTGFESTPGGTTVLCNTLKLVSDLLKTGEVSTTVHDRDNFLKELCDQVVTATGVAYCAGMNMPKALTRVDDSNWSKFVNGSPVFDENGKIAKPDTYRKPDMEGCY